jgi:hypothetical protein
MDRDAAGPFRGFVVEAFDEAATRERFSVHPVWVRAGDVLCNGFWWQSHAVILSQEILNALQLPRFTGREPARGTMIGADSALEAARATLSCKSAPRTQASFPIGCLPYGICASTGSRCFRICYRTHSGTGVPSRRKSGADAEYVFTVEDSGVGVAPVYHDRVFGIGIVGACTAEAFRVSGSHLPFAARSSRTTAAGCGWRASRATVHRPALPCRAGSNSQADVFWAWRSTARAQ